jgi:hypothetical protein
MMPFASAAPSRPSANFSATPRNGSEPLTVRFTDTSTSRDRITAWKWDFDGDGLNNLTEYQIESNPNLYISSSPPTLVFILILATTGVIFSGVLFGRIRRWRGNIPEETRKR